MSDLRLSGVRYELTRTLLHDLDLTFAAGRMTALSGPSPRVPMQRAIRPRWLRRTRSKWS